MKEIIAHFKKVDPVLVPLMTAAFNHSKPIALRRPVPPDQYFSELAESIVGQQLSVKAADTIWGRVVKLLDGKVTPERLLRQNIESLRGVGCSRAKASYLLGLATDVKNGKVKLNNLHELSDEAVLAELTKLKGVGPWTAEMFLMFTLGRPDIFSFLDLGLTQAFAKTYGLTKVSQAEMEAIVAKWSPYRTYAALALWHSRDNPT